MLMGVLDAGAGADVLTGDVMSIGFIVVTLRYVV
jgi:hypothetical protein